MADLNFNDKHKTTYCVPLWVRDEQMRINNKKPGISTVEVEDLKDEPIAIVGYGPSLTKTWKQLRGFKKIISCSGAHKFLLSKGIIPTYHVEVDPREHKIELLGEPDKRVIYMPASCCYPTYVQRLIDAGCEVRLWHVLAKDGESDQVIPAGELQITGGCDVGMRAMTIARVLGYTDFHIFGLDGSIGVTGKSHAGDHPKSPKKTGATVYNGREYKTTPAMLESAKQVFHELTQLSDVSYKFYGDGLIQAQAKDFSRPLGPPPRFLTFKKPELISGRMRDLNRKLHEGNPMYGAGGGKHAETIMKMAAPDSIKSILDYGCGKGQLQKNLPFPIWQYDPAVPEHSTPPRPADLVVCTDVLEHIEPDKLSAVLDDLKRVTTQLGYLVIHIGPAKKSYEDGSNCHLIQQPVDWWVKKVASRFKVEKAVDKGAELHVVVTPKVAEAEPEAPVIAVRGSDGVKSRFYVPNKTCRWRAETLLTKEPATIKWLESIPEGSVLYDVGANVGGYSMWAAVRGVRVVAFEPEAENYSLLTRNIALNKVPVAALCMAVTDREIIDKLHMSQRGLGGSCHSFSESIDAFGAHRNGDHPEQWAVGMSIDQLIERGLPAPDYIKVDVDGLEPRVIKGAHKALKSVKGLLVEVNPSLNSHLEMVDILTKVFKFKVDDAQIREATRADGPFKGVAEHIFYREDPAAEHVIRALESAVLIDYPFPHVYVPDILPKGVYDKMISSLPDDEGYSTIKRVRGLRGYPQRLVGKFDRPAWAGALRRGLIAKFGLSGKLTDEFLLIRDKPGYKIGPHTDHPQRVLSAIMYLAKPGDDESLGTSIYRPKNGKMTCQGGPHHRFDRFEEVGVMPYRPNSMFAFLKTDSSFHGVQPTSATRDVLLFDLQKKMEEKKDG